MKYELIFRVIFLIQLIFIMIFNRILPIIRAKKTGTKLSPDFEAIKNEGLFLFIFRVVSGILLAVVLVIYGFFPKYNNWFQFYLPASIRWIGVLISSIGLIFWIYSQMFLDKNWSGNLKIQEGHKLVKSGPYRVMRHPIYSAMILWSAGLGIFTANLFFIAFTLIVLIWTPLRIAKEEKMLIEYFGDEYLEYRKSTGRYFPKIKGRE